MLCYKCNLQVPDTGTYSCDICSRKVHKECSNLSATEVKCMPLKNRLLKYVCDECSTKMIESSKCVMEIDVATMYKHMMEMTNELKDLKRQIEELTKSVSKAKEDDEPKEKTYAEALVNKDVVIVQPKENQKCEQTRQILQKQVSPKELEVGISKVKPLKNGGVAISCNKKEEVGKLKNEVELKLGDKYRVTVPELMKPRIKIVGMSELMDQNELVESIIRQNKDIVLKRDEIKIICIKKMKKRFMAIAELTEEIFRQIIQGGAVNIGWDTCKVYEYFNVKRCFKCGRYNHKMIDCKNKEICFTCGSESHGTLQCSSSINCVNCREANEKLKLNLDTAHSVYDLQCPAYLRQVDIIKSKTKYV